MFHYYGSETFFKHGGWDETGYLLLSSLLPEGEQHSTDFCFLLFGYCGEDKIKTKTEYTKS